MNKALFLDRDGVINQEVNYLYRVADVAWVDGIFALCRTAGSLGYKIVVVTNQAGIARGYYTVDDFHALMDFMRAEFTAQGCPLDAVYFSPYHPEGQGEYGRDHEDRKPNPGMLLRAAKDLSLDLSQSILVGDRCTDIAAATAAGLQQAFLISGTESTGCRHPHQAVDSLAQVAHWLESESQTIQDAQGWGTPLKLLRFGKGNSATIFSGKRRSQPFQRPCDAQRRIVPADGSLARRMIEIRRLVEHFRRFRQH